MGIKVASSSERVLNKQLRDDGVGCPGSGDAGSGQRLCGIRDRWCAAAAATMGSCTSGIPGERISEFKDVQKYRARSQSDALIEVQLQRGNRSRDAASRVPPKPGWDMTIPFP
ncbi:hypothetical protein PG994_014982 [Apiospora phragmitis]|uniref:Uncharacterized protein n=1 Tax=Apiospora phragmitis TaxID=2905665 RepID=A0ABR1SV65_9PEZI